MIYRIGQQQEGQDTGFFMNEQGVLYNNAQKCDVVTSDGLKDTMTARFMGFFSDRIRISVWVAK